MITQTDTNRERDGDDMYIFDDYCYISCLVFCILLFVVVFFLPNSVYIHPYFFRSKMQNIFISFHFVSFFVEHELNNFFPSLSLSLQCIVIIVFFCCCCCCYRFIACKHRAYNKYSSSIRPKKKSINNFFVLFHCD